MLPPFNAGIPPQTYKVEPIQTSPTHEVAQYFSGLKSSIEGPTGPADFVMKHRLPNQLEKYIPEMVAAENRRKPGLNLKCFSTATDFANHVSNACAEQKYGIERALVVVWTADKVYCHTLAYETAVTPEGVFIRGYDSLDKKISQEHFDPLCAALESLKIPKLKLIVYALGLQKAAAGCEIFALSACLKSHRWAQEGHTLEDFKISQSPYEIKEDTNATFIPPYFFKHAQSKKSVQNIASMSLHEKWATSVNKKNQSLIERHESYRVTQRVPNASDDEMKERTYSNSIDHKRLAFLNRYLTKATSGKEHTR